MRNLWKFQLHSFPNCPNTLFLSVSLPRCLKTVQTVWNCPYDTNKTWEVGTSPTCLADHMRGWWTPWSNQDPTYAAWHQRLFLIDSFLCKQDKTFFLFIKSIKIFCKGLTELQHLTSITKPQFWIQQQLAIQCDHFSESAFYRKR